MERREFIAIVIQLLIIFLLQDDLDLKDLKVLYILITERINHPLYSYSHKVIVRRIRYLSVWILKINKVAR